MIPSGTTSSRSMPHRPRLGKYRAASLERQNKRRCVASIRDIHASKKITTTIVCAHSLYPEPENFDRVGLKNRSTLRACVVSAPDQTSRLNNEVESRTYRPLESTLRCAVSDIFLRRWATSRESTSLSQARTWKGRTVVSNWTMKVPRGSPSPMATYHLTRGGWTIFA